MTPETAVVRTVMLANAQRWGKEALWRLRRMEKSAVPRSEAVLAIEATRTAARFAFLARPDLRPDTEEGVV